MKIKKRQNGVTLISLVVTIIVLLILAGISLAMLTGPNGLINKATQAGTKSIIGEEQERIKLAYNGALSNKYKTDLNGKVTAQDMINEFTINGTKFKTVKNSEEEGHEDDIIIIFASGNEYTLKSNGTIIESSNIASASGTESGGDTSEGDEPVVPTPIVPQDPGNPENPPIPNGFTASTNTAEDEVDEGLVIIDTEGNEYVWIPVFLKSESKTWGVDYDAVKNTYEDTDEYYAAIEAALHAYTSTYRKSDYSDTWYGDNTATVGYYDVADTEKENLIPYTNGNMTETQYNTLYHNMLKSVYKNGGFYVGRYEMGVSVPTNVTQAKNATRVDLNEYTSTDNNDDNSAPTIEGMTNPLSKQGAVEYLYITQSQAEMLAENLNYTSCYSSILFGVQWDVVCVFIENYDTRNVQTPKSKWLTRRRINK